MHDGAQSSAETPVFLRGGGEMGALMRAHDWAAAPLGPPETWPQPLRTAVRLILNTGHPMYVWWGPELRCFYNDAYRASIGHERHPGSLGRPGREVWDEIWPIIGPQIEQVLSGGGATWHENALVPITRNGQLEDVYWTYSYGPIDDEAAPTGVGGVLVVCTETTQQVLAERRARADRERLSFLDRLAAETAALADADAVLETTTRLVGEHMGVSVCAYADMDEDQDGFTIRGDWTAPGAKSIRGHYSLADFGKLAVANLGAGLPLVVNDNLRELAPEEAATFQTIGIAATICMPLVKEGRLTALMAIHDKVPRRWTEEELNLLREVTARSWAHVERVSATAELRHSEARLAEERSALATLVEHLPVGVILVDRQGKTLLHNSAYARIVPEAAIPSRLTDAEERWIGYDEKGQRIRRDRFAGARALRGEIATNVEFLHRAPDGQETWTQVSGVPLHDAAGDIAGAVCVIVDVDAQKRAEKRLRELNETLEQRVADALAERNLLTKLVEITDVMVMAADLDYTILALNAANADEFERVYGVRPKAGDNLLELLADQPEHQEQVRAAWARGMQGEQVTFVEDFGDPDRVRPYYQVNFRPLRNDAGEQTGVYQFVLDVTERLRKEAQLAEAQEQLRQSQKMEAMGQLTGGVAHDFNNLLTPIVASLDILQRRGLGSEREQRLIAGAAQSAERAKTLVQRLLAFARRQPLQPTAVDVADLVRGMADLVSSTTGPQIRVAVEVGDDLPPAKADPNQLEMALLNLAVNARDAMPEGGTLRITAAVETVQPHAAGRLKVKPGQYVRLSVADTGVGMDEATLARAVEPFFSTKGVGKGTGLGLSMVHGLASQLGGALALHSRPGLGTNIELWLPQSESRPNVAHHASEPEAAQRRGTVLLVDDEAVVRLSTAELLEDLGYEIVEAASAEEALGVLRNDVPLDLVITDHLMPGMTGSDLARAVRVLRPGVPVLIISGYAESEGIEPDLPRLTKPFRRDELVASLAGLAGGEAS